MTAYTTPESGLDGEVVLNDVPTNGISASGAFDYGLITTADDVSADYGAIS